MQFTYVGWVTATSHQQKHQQQTVLIFVVLFEDYYFFCCCLVSFLVVVVFRNVRKTYVTQTGNLNAERKLALLNNNQTHADVRVCTREHVHCTRNDQEPFFIVLVKCHISPHFIFIFTPIDVGCIENYVHTPDGNRIGNLSGAKGFQCTRCITHLHQIIPTKLKKNKNNNKNEVKQKKEEILEETKSIINVL